MSEREKLEGLRTHGQVVKTWIPPVCASGFITYDESDREWADYAGLSRYKEEPVALWDVRSNVDDSLLGYTRHDPATHHNERWGCPWLEVAVMRPRRGFRYYDRLQLDHPLEREPIERAHVDLRHFGFGFRGADGVNHQHIYICWFTMPGDAEKLAVAKWLECAGEDCKDDFARDLAMEAYKLDEKRFDYRL